MFHVETNLTVFLLCIYFYKYIFPHGATVRLKNWAIFRRPTLSGKNDIFPAFYSYPLLHGLNAIFLL